VGVEHGGGGDGATQPLPRRDHPIMITRSP